MIKILYIRDHVSYFLLTLLLLRFTIRGFLQARQKKKSCLICHSFPLQCVCVCVFSHRHVQFKTFTWFQCRFVKHISHLIQFSYFLQSNTGSEAHISPLWRFWRISMYRQASNRTPVNTDANAHTSVPWRHVINQTQSLVIIWNPPTHTSIGPLQSRVMVWGRGLKRGAPFP